MSSAVFAIELLPARNLRRLLMYCGLAAAAAGTALILNLPPGAWWRALLAAAWLWQSAVELRAQHRGAARVKRIRLDADGIVYTLGGDGRWQRAELEAGSVVLSGYAWLRLRFADGSRYGELLSDDAHSRGDWHGLQLIWRQRRNAFGAQDRS